MKLLYETQQRINALVSKTETLDDFMDNISGMLMEITGAKAGLVITKEGPETACIRGFCADVALSKQIDLKNELESRLLPIQKTGIGEFSGFSNIPKIDDTPDFTLEYRISIASLLGRLDNVLSIPFEYQEEIIGVIELYEINKSVWDEVSDTIMSISVGFGILYKIFRQKKELSEKITSLKGLATITESIKESYQIEMAIDLLLKNSKRFFSAFGSSLLIKDKDDRIIFVSVEGDQAPVVKGQEIVKGEGIVGWVMGIGEPVIVENVDDDDRFSARIDSMTGIKTQSVICAPLKVLNETVGALEVIRTEGMSPFNEKDLEILVILASHASMALYKERQFTQRDKWFKSTLSLLDELIKVKDRLFPENRKLIKKYVVLLGLEMNLAPDDMKKLDLAASIKDIGKIVIPDKILSKEGELTDEEWQKVMGHPLISVDILRNIEEFREIIPIIKYHHEKYDGSGYPEGLSGDSIPRLARIFSIADSYAAMISERPYREPLSKEQAKEILIEQKGRQFDPELVDIFIKTVE